MSVQAYHRPTSVAAALALLQRRDVRTTVVAGGVSITPRLKQGVDEVVDLQAVSLDEVWHSEGRMETGAMVRLQTIVDDEEAPLLLRQTARLAGPRTFRCQGTIGGAIVAAEATSELLAALLVLQAEVTVANAGGERQLSLADFLTEPAAALGGGLLVGLSLAKTGITAHARVARTPADAAIVAAVARRVHGDCYLALCGVAQRSVLVDAADLDKLDPPGDFRGSSAYRKEMSRVLSARVLAEIEEACESK